MSKKLAIFGGKKIRKNPMPFRIAFGKSEVKNLNKAVKFYRDRKLDPPYSGKFEEKLCKNFSKFMGGGFSDAVTSGTAAIYTALLSFKLAKESEVIITAVTDCGPLNCIIQMGLKPKIADTAKNSYNSCVGTVIDSVTKKTKCIIATHAAGEPMEGIDKLYKFCKKNKIFLIEDCSQSTGATYKGKKIGNFSDISAFSTMYRKTLHTGGNGGIVFTKNKKLYHNLLAAADKGKQVWRNDIDLRDPNNSIMSSINFTQNELASAIGIGSLSRLEKTLKKRKNWVKRFIPELKKTKTCYPYRFNNSFSVFFFPIFVRVEKLKCSKKQFANALMHEGIGLQPHYGCIISDWRYSKKYFKSFKVAKNATNIRDHSFNLFVNENYGSKEIKDIIKGIIKVENYYLKKNEDKIKNIDKKMICCGFKNNKCEYYNS